MHAQLCHFLLVFQKCIVDLLYIVTPVTEFVLVCITFCTISYEPVHENALCVWWVCTFKELCFYWPAKEEALMLDILVVELLNKYMQGLH